MVIKHRGIRENPTAVERRYQASGLTAQSSSLRHERFGLESLFNRLGRPNIQIRLWDGFAVGTPDESIGTVTFNNRSALYHLLFWGEVAFGDGYCVGSIDIEGNLVDILVDINARRRNRAGVGAPFEKLPLARFRSTNTLGGAQENIHHHYDIGNDFYRLWLDDEMQYTCAYFLDPDMTLEAAQQAKMDHVCRKLQLQPGDRVVEAGCGWGGLARHMAKYYGAKVTAYNISKEQVRYASDRAHTEGYDDKVSYIEDDYRNIKGSFDVFVSVGMLEHVGKENYKILGDVIESSLAKEGRALIHSIGRNVARPMSAWIDRRIFPGAYPPTLSEMMNILEPNRFSVLDVENLRLHYARTLEHWLQRFELSNLEISEMFDERFLRMWEFYLLISKYSFVNMGNVVFQIQIAKNINNLPIKRRFEFDKTVKLIQNSKLVVAHDSTAIHLAILFHKPVVLIYNNEFKLKPLQCMEIIRIGEMLGAEILNERAKKVFKNKSLADKFKHMEIDRQLEKEEEASQDNIFPESRANLFTKFGQAEELREFHLKTNWNDKYMIALTIRDPRASFILKRLIFDESPQTLSKEDFKMVHRELHDRLVINQERPFTTIPEAMTQIDTEFSNLDDTEDELKAEKIIILKEYNKYLSFMEKYFSNKNAEPLPTGSELCKHIFG